MMVRAIILTVVVYVAACIVIVAATMLGATFGSAEVGLVLALAVAIQVLLIKHRRALRPREPVR